MACPYVSETAETFRAGAIRRRLDVRFALHKAEAHDVSTAGATAVIAFERVPGEDHAGVQQPWLNIGFASLPLAMTPKPIVIAPSPTRQVPPKPGAFRTIDDGAYDITWRVLRELDSRARQDVRFDIA